MSRDHLNSRLSNPASRRTVVKTGAKLAYAAPLVAATMKLSAAGTAAGAISGGPDCPQPSPSSSFVFTCFDITTTCTDSGTILTANCEDVFGSVEFASINVNTCSASGYIITNCNAVLVCGSTC